MFQYPNEKKVRASGPGLCSGLLGSVEGVFQIDTTGGGPGILRVSVHGPKDCFDVKIGPKVGPRRYTFFICETKMGLRAESFLNLRHFKS